MGQIFCHETWPLGKSSSQMMDFPARHIGRHVWLPGSGGYIIKDLTFQLPNGQCGTPNVYMATLFGDPYFSYGPAWYVSVKSSALIRFMVHMTILSNGSSHALGDSSHFTNRLVDTFHISHKKNPRFRVRPNGTRRNRLVRYYAGWSLQVSNPSLHGISWRFVFSRERLSAGFFQ
jgi:hypothetical protein